MILLLTGKQKRYLRKQAHHLKAIFQVGKQGVNEPLVQQINDALEKRELIKITVLQNCLTDKHTVAAEIVEGTDALLVQIIGSQIVLYKQSAENPKIDLANL